jgi:hypothetical protein
MLRSRQAATAGADNSTIDSVNEIGGINGRRCLAAIDPSLLQASVVGRGGAAVVTRDVESAHASDVLLNERIQLDLGRDAFGEWEMDGG